MAARPAALLAGFPDTHFIPSRSAEPSSARPGSSAGIACANDAWGRGCTPILGGSSAPSASPRSVASARSSRSGSDGMAAATSAPVR